MILQPIVNIAEICAQKGITDFVLSPGSRCAPLTIALVRHPAIKTRSVPDERSAAFIGLGMAQETQRPVGLLCTSGTAALNYAPAVTEAYYQHIPMLVLTADRPAEWVDQLDGQTIHQQNIFANHIKASYQLPSDYSHTDAVWAIERIMSEAINVANAAPYGPVHVNIPLREPFYPEAGEELHFDKAVKIIEVEETENVLSEKAWEKLLTGYKLFENCLIVAGQHQGSKSLSKTLDILSSTQQIPVVADVIANVDGVKNHVRHQDFILATKDEKQRAEFQPDLLITYGNSVLCKNLKLLLRKYKPKAHWHVQVTDKPADPFQSLTKSIAVEPEYFFDELYKRSSQGSNKKVFKVSYLDKWSFAEDKSGFISKNCFRTRPFCEMQAVWEVMDALPENSLLHLANSMTVRYANYRGAKEGIVVRANRGTSGIDGSSSTAIGSALAQSRPVTLITGDLAFFYDRNALWNNYVPPNLRIVILNNHGGGIFRILDGPNRQPELADYFETVQKLNAENTARDFGLDYYLCKSKAQLDEVLKTFWQDSKAAILEIETDAKVNTEVLKDLLQNFR